MCHIPANVLQSSHVRVCSYKRTRTNTPTHIHSQGQDVEDRPLPTVLPTKRAVQAKPVSTRSRTQSSSLPFFPLFLSLFSPSCLVPPFPAVSFSLSLLWHSLVCSTRPLLQHCSVLLRPCSPRPILPRPVDLAIEKPIASVAGASSLGRETIYFFFLFICALFLSLSLS